MEVPLGLVRWTAARARRLDRAFGAAWALAAAAILVLTLWPPDAFRAHGHWERISWVPFADPWGKPWELVANVLLFAPFGYLGTRALGAGRRAALAVALCGLALSLAVETAQIFAHDHFPSATDVVANLLGAGAGAAVAARRGGRGGRRAA